MPKKPKPKYAVLKDTHPFQDVVIALPVRRPPLQKRQPGEPLTVVDLFSGAGGTSSGVMRALKHSGHPVNLVTVNHWEVACDTMRANYGMAQVYQHGVDEVDPGAAVPGGRIDLLVASPECLTYSSARGDKPIREQSRSSAAFIYEWLSHPKVRVDNFILENVREWESWGPLDSNQRVIKEREGEYFDSFIAEIRKLGYDVDYRVLNAADYGEATSRQRLFVMGRSDQNEVSFPTPTHTEKPGSSKIPGLKKWIPARDIINWDNKGTSIFNRPQGPHSPKSIRRMRAGFEKQKTALAPAYTEALRRFEVIAEEFDAGCKRIEANYQDTKTNKEHVKQRHIGKEVLREIARKATIAAFETPVGEYRLDDLIRILDQADATQPQDSGPDTRIVSLFMGQHGGSQVRDATTDPAMTIATKGAISKFDGTLVDAMMVKMNASDSSAYDDATRLVNKTKTTIVAKDCTGIAIPGGAKEAVETEYFRIQNAYERILPDLDAKPFVSQQRSFYSDKLLPYSATSPDQTVSGITAHTNHHAIVSPSASVYPETFISHLRGFFAETRIERSASSIEKPIDSIAAGGLHHGIVAPHIDAFLTPRFSERVATDMRYYTTTPDATTPTPTGNNVGYVLAPNLIGTNGSTTDEERKNHSTGKRQDLVRPHILIDGQKHVIEITFRMVMNSELSRFTGFDTDEYSYTFTGNATEVTRQIGNAVPVHLAKALVEEQLRHYLGRRPNAERSSKSRTTLRRNGSTV